MRLINDEQAHTLDVDYLSLEIFFERLRCHKENALSFVCFSPLISVERAIQLLNITEWYFSDRIPERFNLLHDEGSSWRHEKDKSIREPAIVIEHDSRGDKGFTQTSGQCHDCIFKERCAHYIELIGSESFDSWVDPLLDTRRMYLSLWQATRVVLYHEIFFEQKIQFIRLIEKLSGKASIHCWFIRCIDVLFVY